MTDTAPGWSNVRFDYAGRHVLVAGGTSGIGAGVARAYRAAGAMVWITGQRPAASDYETDLSAFRYLRMDITSDADVAAAANALPSLDIVVNSAGVAWVGGGYGEREYEPEIFERAIRMHLTGPYRLAHACHSKLTRSSLAGGASVIGVASMASFFGIEVVPGYGAAKAGLVQMTKTLAIRWARDNIRVNAVAAGLTESAMTSAMIASPEAIGPTLARTPLGRVGQPEDIAGAVLYLTSDAARHVTGQTAIVDGGYSVVG